MLYYEVNLVDATTSFLDFYCIFIKYYLWMKYLPYQICLEWVKNMLDYVFVTVCIYWLWEQQSFEALLWASNCVLSEIPDFFVWGPFINKRWFLSFPFLTKSKMYKHFQILQVIHCKFVTGRWVNFVQIPVLGSSWWKKKTRPKKTGRPT